VPFKPRDHDHLTTKKMPASQAIAVRRLRPRDLAVAVTTGKREIIQRGGAAMLLGNDVINMKR
jgi:hypothetical protein